MTNDEERGPRSVSPLESASPGESDGIRSRRQTLHEKRGSVAQRLKTGQAAQLYARLNAVDFMNSAFQFSALMLMCLFPVLVVITAFIGGDIRKVIVSRMGLDRAATSDLDRFMSSGHTAVASLGVLSAASWPYRPSPLPAPCRRGTRGSTISEAQRLETADRLPPRLVRWIRSPNLVIGVGGAADRSSRRQGSDLLVRVRDLNSVLVVEHVLAAPKKNPLAQPLAQRTRDGILPDRARCLLGASFLGSVVSDQKSYGSVGVMMAILSYLIGFGVCIHLGAVFGRLWNEGHQGQD